MRRLIPTLMYLLSVSSVVQGQYPQQPVPGSQPGQFGGYDQITPNVNPNLYMPNIYNQQYQPLSPYLFSVRGTNPSVDYFFNTRPGTLGAGARGAPTAPFIAPGGARLSFFPQLAYAPEPFGPGLTSEPSVLPPAGHPAVFNNTLGYYPSPFGQAGGRPGLGALGGVQKK